MNIFWKVAMAAIVTALLLAGYEHWAGVQQRIGYDAAVAEYTKKDNEALTAALEETKRLNRIVKDAEDAAKKREDENRKLTARNADLLVRMRDTDRAIADAVSGATRQALANATESYSTLFADCRRQFEEMGRAAAGHFIDAQRLSDAWPE